MSDNNTKIKFQVEGIQTIRSEMTAILRDMVTQTQLMEKSGENIVNGLRKQIELIKERNGLNSQFTGEKQSQQLDPTLSLTLKDLNTTLKDLVETLSKEGGQNLPSTPSEPITPRTPDNLTGFTPQQLQTLGLTFLMRPLSSRDPINAGLDLSSNIGSSMMLKGGKAGWIGLAIAAVAGIAKMQYDIISEIEPASARMARLQGGRPGDYLDIRRNEYDRLGFGRADVLNNRADLIKALGRDSDSNLASLLALQRGFDISQEELIGVSRVGRGESNFNLNRVFTSLYSGLQYAGLGKEKTEALIPEYLRLLTEIGQSQLETLGKVDFGVNTKLITALSSEERLQNPATLGNVVQGIIKGLSVAPTPQLEALQFQALSRAFPGKSYWQLEKIRQAPFEAGNEQYSLEYIRNLKATTSTREDFEMAISKAFGLNANISSSVANAFLKGDFETLKKEIQPSITQEQVLQRGMEAANRLDKAAAAWENLKIGDLTQAISDGFDRVLEKMDVGSSPRPNKNFDQSFLSPMKRDIILTSYVMRLLDKLP